MSKKEVVLIGAGKIGRGYLAELFDVAGYHLTFLEYSDELTKAMRDQGKYLIIKRHADGTHSRATIAGYDALCTQTEYENAWMRCAIPTMPPCMYSPGLANPSGI